MPRAAKATPPAKVEPNATTLGKRGRPRKVDTEIDSNPVAGPSSLKPTTPADQTPAKRGRGRPRKYPVAAGASSSPGVTPSDENVVKRGRGRPRTRPEAPKKAERPPGYIERRGRPKGSYGAKRKHQMALEAASQTQNSQPPIKAPKTTIVPPNAQMIHPQKPSFPDSGWRFREEAQVEQQLGLGQLQYPGRLVTEIERQPPFPEQRSSLAFPRPASHPYYYNGPGSHNAVNFAMPGRY